MTDVQAVPLPASAITAAAEAILSCPYPKVGEGTARNFAVAALKAAAPAIAAQAAAAERERIIALARQHKPTYWEPSTSEGKGGWQFFADLLDGGTDGH